MDDAYLVGEQGETGWGSENKAPCVAAAQLSLAGHPQVAWVLSNGLNCFPGAEQTGAVHAKEVVGAAATGLDTVR